MRQQLFVLGLATALSILCVPDARAAALPASLSSAHTNAPAQDPVSGMVLYRQAGTSTGSLLAQTSASGSNSVAADDFNVTDATGWSVSAFNFAVVFPNYSPPAETTYNVNVYADDAGKPAATALCSANNAGGILDNDNTMLSVPLPQVCLLPQGTYWVSLQTNIVAAASPLFTPVAAWSGFAPTPVPGSIAAWKNPGDSSQTGCVDWSPATSCNFGVSALIFDVIGFPGGGDGNALTMTLTFAMDNGDPAQCGTATSIEARAGDKINLCYTMINHTGTDLAYQTLSDTLSGSLYTLGEPIADGATYRYNRIYTAETAISGVVQATLTAQHTSPGYHFDDTGASQFVDITAIGTLLDPGNEGTRAADMPFSFHFYDTTTNVLGVSTNGGIYVGGVRPLQYNNQALPSSAIASYGFPAIVPLWDDFEVATQGGVYYATLGTEPNRSFVVEWSNLVHYNSASNTDGATFEVIFDEASGNFSFEYADADYSANGGSPDPAVCDGGVCATIGVQKDMNFATQYSYDTASISSGKSIRWAPGVITAFTTTAAANLDVGAPLITAAPGVLMATAVAGSSTSAALTIGNTGNRDLDWSVDEAGADINDARAHFPRMPYHAPAPSAQRLRALSAAQFSATPTTATHANTVPDSPRVSTTAAIPAFAIGGINEATGGGINPSELVYFSLDAADPSILTGLSAFPIYLTYAGGAFANNDFSKEYVTHRGGGLSVFDTTTGERTFIGGQTLSGMSLSDLAWDPTTQTMYVTGHDFASTSYLFTVDLATAVLTPVAQIDNVMLNSATFDSTGHMYGLDLLGSQLVAIDKRNGQWQGIGPIGFDVYYHGSIDFDPRTGLIWYAGSPLPTHIGLEPPIPAMYTINPASGRANEIGPTAQQVDLYGFALAIPYTGCSMPGDVPWLTVTPTSGVTPPGTLTTVTAAFDAKGLTAGSYEANICLRSDDLANRVVGVPVRFTVTTNDTIFADGFDAP